MSAPGAMKVDLDRSVVTLGGRRLVFHCHHYNVFLQRTVEEGLRERAPLLLTAAAAETSRATLAALEAESPAGSPAAVVARAAEILQTNGFGRADVTSLGAQGGTATMAPSHYALGWVAKWGKRATPCCFFAAGWLGGAVAVAGGHAPERVNAREVACIAAGADRCTFVVEVW